MDLLEAAADPASSAAARRGGGARLRHEPASARPRERRVRQVPRFLALALRLVMVAGAPLTARAWRVLVLGGSGFRGHPTTEYLARLGHNVTVLSRGNSYWGVLERLRNQSVAHWKCNRTLEMGTAGRPLSEESGLALCAPLIADRGARFDAVVDFSSKTLEQLRQAIALLRGRVGVYVFMSSHAVYDVSVNSTHEEDPRLVESDARRPGRELSPLDRFNLKGKNTRGDAALECEEELMKQFNGGGFPFVSLRLTNTIGPKENTIRYWLIHLWLRAHLALRLPMHVDETLVDTPISFTYTLDIAQAVLRVISKARNETCCPEHVEAEAFNLACEEAPTLKVLYNRIAEPMGLAYVETIEMQSNKSIVMYPEIQRGPVSIEKANAMLGWSPTDLGKALRSVARFYDRTMIDENKYKNERGMMYEKCKRSLSDDGPRFVSWIKEHYFERRKLDLCCVLDGELAVAGVFLVGDALVRRAGR
eukprot:TRINITY_DN13096_c0_g1_i1.p1 TRINITY_DN13096_c0_g1~~TRINITY_DN13096_c0_g1_i1.p1  ORF type:complete len:524 (+),score=100.15 TRINITY_DN13096_c0_g1_i1:140-1573(+)